MSTRGTADDWSDIAAQLRTMRREFTGVLEADDEQVQELRSAFHAAHSIALKKVEEIRHDRTVE
ncbi:hypothetical protein [Streptomyces sp. NPDC050485]|uniref:hypothetical protein n=1 Tax=Streptomyces sp. NPDC050485 TaxID=3365617 RepID=UPI0037B079BC